MPARKNTGEKATDCARSAVAVVEPHSTSMPPERTIGSRSSGATGTKAMRKPRCHAGASGSSRSRFSAAATSAATPRHRSTAKPTGCPALVAEREGHELARTPSRMVPRAATSFSVPVSTHVLRAGRGRAADAAGQRGSRA